MSANGLTKRWSEPLTGVKTHDTMTTDHRPQASLAIISGRSAWSR
jgi:hypothetical protein